MRAIFIIVCCVFLSGCSFLNMFKGPNDFYRHYEASILKDGIDEDIQEEIRKDVPNGYRTKPYSREVWNEYWNSRINDLYDLGKTPATKAYKGPSGPEFISYIFKTRKTNGLPELVIEERNRDKIP